MIVSVGLSTQRNFLAVGDISFGVAFVWDRDRENPKKVGGCGQLDY